MLSSSADALLSARGLRKAYVSGGTRQLVLDDLDLDLARGEIVAVIGASGSGKTSLLNLLCGIDSPDAGDVVIDGIDVHARREPDKTLFRRRHVGFVFQFFNLIPTLTVRENLALPLELLGRPQAEIAMRVSGLLDGIALAHIAERFPDTLSGGEQQRVAVARALAHTPSLLLADEPTGNLDTHTAGNVTALLIDMTRAHRAAMVIVTHSPAVAACADRQLRLADGRLVGV
ncbi:MAG: ABC transporter ATP-binding protein [Gammaproteobacteria bacterium]|nr:ABC transporter ATP-binding protein [Gammaproteobacteria bacterium]MCP5299659.1 ABC transporter ATP-binding protein [Chromatiaceae bacterium]